MRPCCRLNSTSNKAHLLAARLLHCQLHNGAPGKRWVACQLARQLVGQAGRLQCTSKQQCV